MADDNDILDSFLDEDLDADIPVVVGGKRRLMQRGQIVDAPTASAAPKTDDQSAATTASDNSQSATTESKESSASAEDKEKEPPAGDFDVAAQYAEDEKEIKEETIDLSEKVNQQETSEADKLMRELTDEAEAACGAQFAADEDIQRRFHMVVEAFFKDLRDSLETKSKLTMPTGSGGLGLTDEQAAKVMETLSKKRKEYETSFSDKAQKDRKKFVDTAVDKQLHDSERADKKDKDDLDKRYKERGGKTPDIVVDEKPAKPAAPPTKVIKVEGSKKAAAPAKVSQATTPAAQDSKSEPKEPHVEENELADALKAFFDQDQEQEKIADERANDRKTKVEGDKNKSKQEPVASAGLPTYTDSKKQTPPAQPAGSPPPNLPVVDEPPKERADFSDGRQPEEKTSRKPEGLSGIPSTPATTPKQAPPKPPAIPKPPAKPAQQKPIAPPPVAPAAPSKPVMSDIKTTPKLLGPIEELRSITLKDFRRLSKDPKEATLKIRDKIDLLGEEQSFEAKTAGVKAWRESPTNKLYLETLRRSLEGIPISAVMTQMEEAGEDTLEKAEFDAIMKLNREIRFG